MDPCVRMAESLCCPPETITTLLIIHTSTQNKVFFFLKKEKNHLVDTVSFGVHLLNMYCMEPAAAINKAV